MIAFRHLARIHAVRIVAGLLSAVLLLLLADFVELAPALTRQPDAVRLGLSLYLHKLPGLVLQALPLAVLFGVLFAVADLYRHRELLALRAAGASDLQLAAPPVLLAALLSVGGLWLADGPAPAAQREVVALQTARLGRWTWSWTLFHTRRAWYRGDDGRLLHVESVADEGRRLEGVTVFVPRNGRLTAVARADAVTWDGAHWRGAEATTWEMDPDLPERLTVRPGLVPLTADPVRFEGILGQPEELTGSELTQAIALRRAQGQPTLALEVERSGRVTLPLLGLALAVLALGLTLGVRAPATAGSAALVGIVVAFTGWMLLALMRALGLAGVASPVVAAWVPVVVPLTLGGGLLALGSRFRILSRFRR